VIVRRGGRRADIQTVSAVAAPTAALRPGDPDCGHPLEKRGDTCPACGGTSVTIKMTATAAIKVTATAQLTVEKAVIAFVKGVVEIHPTERNVGALIDVLQSAPPAVTLQQINVALAQSDAAGFGPIFQAFQDLHNADWFLGLRLLVIVLGFALPVLHVLGNVQAGVLEAMVQQWLGAAEKRLDDEAK